MDATSFRSERVLMASVPVRIMRGSGEGVLGASERLGTGMLVKVKDRDERKQIEQLQAGAMSCKHERGISIRSIRL